MVVLAANASVYINGQVLFATTVNPLLQEALVCSGPYRGGPPWWEWGVRVAAVNVVGGGGYTGVQSSGSFR